MVDDAERADEPSRPRFPLLSTLAPQDLLERGAEHHTAGRLLEAELCYRHVLAQDPDNADALHLLGVVAQQHGQHEDAVDLIRDAIARNARVAAYHSNLGLSLRDAGRLTEATESLERALSLQPEFTEALNNLGTVLRARDDLPGAAACFRRALALRPDQAEVARSLAETLRDLLSFDEAVAVHEDLIARSPARPQAYNDMAITLVRAGRLEEARHALGKALELDPDDAVAHWNEAVILLTLGDFDQGWRKYEWRRRVPGFGFRAPRDAGEGWNGTAAPGSRLLLYTEQGFGDTLQFVRYLPQVIDRVDDVVLSVQPELHSLLALSFPAATVVRRDEQQPTCDLHCPLLSLPRIFATRLETIPAEIPYLKCDPKRTKLWADRLARGEDLRIGLAWAGSSSHGDDRRRSLDPKALRPLLERPGIQWLSLQVGHRAGDLAALGPASPRDLSGEVSDFTDTAAVIANLDLVVTVDTAIAHLAGALGRPAWLMLPYVPDWRWMQSRDHSPWYPSLRLFRQPAIGDWTSVVRAVDADLQRLLNGDDDVLGSRSAQVSPA